MKHAFSEADLMQACLQRTKVNAYSAGSATHERSHDELRYP